MKILLPLAIITAFLLWYALHGREWLKSKPWAEGFFALIEPVEIWLYKKSETILVARLKIVVGAVLTLLTQIGSIDLTPFMPFVPEKYQPFVNFGINMVPLLISLIGMMDERLRNTTTKPLELVSIPDKVVEENPLVAAVVADANAAKINAVEVVAIEAKAA